MREIVISPKYLKREILILLFCFIFSFLLNILGIILYKTPWHEIFTQFGYVVIISFVVYFTVTLLRLIIFLLYTFFKRLWGRLHSKA